MTLATNLGFPRIGEKRELKKALEAFWSGDIDETSLQAEAEALRKRHWQLQREIGIESIPSGDFSYYDQMLDTIAMLGAVPGRYGCVEAEVSLNTYFAMARGTRDVPAMEMTKWFDTNYHYIVPELRPDLNFHLACNKILEEYREAALLGIETRPVLVGPVTFLKLAKVKAGDRTAQDYLPDILPVYEELLAQLKAAGAEWVQLDEPVLSLDLEPQWLDALSGVYQRLAKVAPKIMLASYFGSVAESLPILLKLPVAGVHLDLVRGADQLRALAQVGPMGKVVSLGIVDGRNIWRTDLSSALADLEEVKKVFGPAGLQVAPSCSLLHVPVDLELEADLDDDLKNWLAFAVQKLDEVAVLAGALVEGRAAYAPAFDESDDAAALRRQSVRVHNPQVRARGTEPAIRPAKIDRAEIQRAHLDLPAFPTTTIGSFPQTQTIRQARLAFKKGVLSQTQYDQFLEEETRKAIRAQEELGLDVLVHGEFERTDMVEYFGDLLEGVAVTKFGWVQSYGSRCVKPPVIFGDVCRPAPMTVRWSSFAQSCTEKPVKGMLTGPVTILQWSFVRDDQPRMETCRQIALAIQDEVRDLEAAGLSVIQIDEPALREGLPLRVKDQSRYLREAVACFQLAANNVTASTQIHTHMCYSEFDDILPAIAALDVDVISIEASRSDMDILEAFDHVAVEAEIGLGVYDIHSPRCPAAAEMGDRLKSASHHLRPEQLWVNPDCGLKTRRWEEVLPALENMVAAARSARLFNQGQNRH